MRFSIILAAFAALFAGQVQADCNGAFVSDCQNTTTNNTGIGVGVAAARADANAAAAAGASASVRTEQEQVQVQQQGQQQGQIQGNIGLGSGNKTSVQIDAPVIPNKVKNVAAPDVTTGQIFTANACALGLSVGGSGVGGGGALGVSWESADCRKQQVAAQFHSAGLKDDALAVLCTVESAGVAPSCKKLAAEAKRAQAEEAARLARTSGPDLSDPYIRSRLGK